ncbi:hypothetical protein NIES3585_28790 [Nodularia sp. NIES-3585]|nr:hypothetical protein NIES3585_28790 [Nodularia sp. NIES-3585]
MNTIPITKKACSYSIYVKKLNSRSKIKVASLFKNITATKIEYVLEQKQLYLQLVISNYYCTNNICVAPLNMNKSHTVSRESRC